jgi:2-polyprenyl-3-methyl-5-hydroxy-6-metoxy-1,4-benzoquinol methylase
VDSTTDKHNEEAAAFDRQILTRVKNGHRPDLRHSGRCEWFRNNVWRDSVYVDMVFGAIARQIQAAVVKYLKVERANILEVGCGPGHISLEMSRYGHNVCGIDLSPECIEVAQRVAGDAPTVTGQGRLEYICQNLVEVENSGYDMVVFVGALHHFPNVKDTLRQVRGLLSPRGLLFVSEPSREDFSRSDAAIIHLIRGLLALGQHYHETLELPRSADELDETLTGITREVTYVDAQGDKTQSPLDMESTFNEISQAAGDLFEELESCRDFSFVDCIVGGLRFPTVDEEHAAARWLRNIDRILCETGVANARWRHLVARREA